MTDVATPDTAHPLDSLSGEEFKAVAAILRRDKGLTPSWRIASIELREPSKQLVREFTPGDDIVREARVVAWDRESNTTYKGIVSITGDEVRSWDKAEGHQPNATVDEFHDVDVALRENPDVIAALADRGLTDMSLVLIDLWTFGGHLIPEKYKGRRLGWCDVWVRKAPTSNPYANPVSGLKFIVDMNSMELLEIEDDGAPDLPGGFAPVDGEYSPEHIEGYEARTDRKPLEITQPDGVSFELIGNELRWQRWRMRLGFNWREGLVIHRVGYEDGVDENGETRVRSIADRISFAEMVVPYRDPTVNHKRRTAYDIGEWGVGFMTQSLELGCDCLGEIVYVDATLHDTTGEPYDIPKAICLHEEDAAVLWKHVDERDGAQVRRMRRMVVSCHFTVANYEYLVYWRFYEDGNIECEVRATGIMVTTPFVGDTPPPYGTVVDYQTYAPIHQHFITARLDLSVDSDGDRSTAGNTVVMSETQQPPIGPDNPHGLALTQRNVPLTTEAEGIQDYNWSTQRAWKVTNPNRFNKMGTPVAYKLAPGGAFPAMIDSSSPVIARAGVIEHSLWVTPYEAEERWPSGEFVNQSSVDEGLPMWTKANRNIADTDVVLWYTFGIHHVPRPEEWPVMASDIVSFWLKPSGFFNQNPGIDVAPAPGGACH